MESNNWQKRKRWRASMQRARQALGKMVSEDAEKNRFRVHCGMAE